MSVTLDGTSTTRIDYHLGLSCMIFVDSPEKKNSNTSSRLMAGITPPTRDQMVPAKDEDSCSSSSIGRNSDSDGEDDGEVQSNYKGPLDSMDALQDVLPIKRGISKFYSGKSKSFTSLADASSNSIKEIAKPDDAYTRKRKNLIATSIIMDRYQNNPLRSSAGISKRLTSSGRPTFSHPGTPTSSSESITSENSNTSSSSPPPPRLPPLHPQPRPSFSNAQMSQPMFSPRRAFSLTDLQIANDNHSSSTSNKDESKKQH